MRIKWVPKLVLEINVNSAENFLKNIHEKYRKNLAVDLQSTFSRSPFLRKNQLYAKVAKQWVPPTKVFDNLVGSRYEVKVRMLFL